jgi:signal recognition particle receptor subunit beta
MVQINFAQKQVNAKIVFYGPGMSGKTTNLEIIHQRAPTPNKGELTSISTDGDRTLFFDFMPLDLGTVAGMRTCFQIYTVPGQVYYNSTRKLVLQGVDGVVFVADSSASMVEENLESMKNLEQNLAEYGKSLASLPIVIQYNKRDLPDALSIEELNALLNPHGFPYFEAIAANGQGVFPTLKGLAAKVLESIHGGSRQATVQAPAAPTPTISSATQPSAALSQTGFRPRAMPTAAQANMPAASMPAASMPAASMPAASMPAASMPAAEPQLAGAQASMPAPLPPMPTLGVPAHQPLAAQTQHAPSAAAPTPAAPTLPTMTAPAPTAAASVTTARPLATRPAPAASPLSMLKPDAAATAVRAPAPKPIARTQPAPATAPKAPVHARPAASATPAAASLQKPLPASRGQRLLVAGGFVGAALVVGAVLAKFVFPLL